MKQTAVEFIEEYLLLNYYDTMRYAGIDLSDVIEQAKEMEEKQKLDAYLRGIENLKQLLKDKQNDSSRMVN